MCLICVQVDEQLIKYETIRDSINNLQSPMDIGWLRINSLPIKSQLMTWTSRWIEMFIKCLRSSLVEKLEALNTFMAQVNKGLDVEIDGK